MVIYIGDKEVGAGIVRAASFSIDGTGSITLIPVNAEGKKAVFETLSGRHQGGTGFLREHFQGNDNLIVTTGWKGGILRNILLQNKVNEMKADACKRIMARSEADKTAYDAAVLEKKRLEEERKEALKFKALIPTDEKQLALNTEMEIKSIEQQLASVKKIISASRAGRKQYMDAKKRKPQKQSKKAADMLEELKAIFPHLYVEIRGKGELVSTMMSLSDQIVVSEPLSQCIRLSFQDKYADSYAVTADEKYAVTTDEKSPSCAPEDAPHFLCRILNTTKDRDIIAKMNVTVLPPDINLSEYDFTVTNANEVRTGLRCISERLGRYDAAVKQIIERRPYGSVRELLVKTATDGCATMPPELFACFVKSGALDALNDDRNALLGAFGKRMTAKNIWALEDIIEKKRVKETGTEEIEKRLMERDVLGFVPHVRLGVFEECELTGMLLKVNKARDRQGDGALALTVLGNDGTRILTMAGNAYRKYKEEAYSLVGGKIKVKGRNKDGIFAVNRLEQMPACPKNMLLRHVSREDIEFVNTLGSDAIKNKRNPIRVAVLTWDGTDKTHLGPAFYYFTEEAVELCKEHGMKFSDPDRPIFAPIIEI